MKIGLDLSSLAFDQFEAFLRALLNAKPVIPIKIGEGETHLERYDLVHRYGKQGDKQRGIDLLGTLQEGEQIVFQCKHHDPNAGRPRVGKTQADQAIALAGKKYPAKYFALITNTGFTNPAIDSLTAANWLKWGDEQLNDLLRALPIATGYHLVVDHFGPTEANRLYPLGPDLLVTPEHYQSSRNDALAHKYACVGREREINALMEALMAKAPQAVLLSGEGGLGKSRIFCEVLSRLGQKWTTRILQPEIREASAKQVDLLETNRLIIGMDECHLEGYFRQDVSLSVRKANGRLLLVCRPEAVPKLRQILRDQGWDWIEPLQNSGGLQPLDKPSMHQLAETVLGDSHRFSHQLVGLSAGNPLITVVGGEMLRDTKLDIPSLIQSPDFRQKVFQHLEDSYLRLIDERSHRFSRRLLRLLAILSPCTKEQLPGIARLLEIGELALEDGEIEQLRRAGLIRGSNENFRVIPDLFSDYLVRDALTEQNDFGLLQRLTRSELITKGGVAVFRNLAMARWGGDSNAAILDPLIRQLWESYQNKFRDGHDSERSDLISSWRRWALYLPDESLAFAKLALGIESRPDPDWALLASPDRLSFRLKGIHAEAIRILSDLAKHHANYQSRALALLWKHRDKETKSNGRNKPGSIAQIFGPELNRSIESPLFALKWLRAEVAKPEIFDEWTATRTTDPSYFLKPAFIAFLEDNHSVGNQFIFRSVGVSFENTAPLRGEAFGIIDSISFASPKGAMNCLDLLQSIAWPVHSPFGGKTNETWTAKWEADRFSALDRLLKIANNHDHDLVRFLVRANALQLSSVGGESSAFYETCETILKFIPESPGLNLARVLLSNGYTEFVRPRSTQESQQNREQYQIPWAELCDATAAKLIADIPFETTLGAHCDQIAEHLIDHGLQPSFFSLFDAIHRIAPHEVEPLRLHILNHPACRFSSQYTQLSTFTMEAAIHDKRLAEGVNLQRPELFSAICRYLHYSKETKSCTLTLAAAVESCELATEEQIQTILNSVIPYASGALNELLLANLPWAKVNESHIESVEGGFNNRSRGAVRLPDRVLPGILERLNQLPLETISKATGIIDQACRNIPAIAFSFFEERMDQTRNGKGETEYPYVFPCHFTGGVRFADPAKIPNYEARVRTIFTELKRDPENELLRNWFQFAAVDTSEFGVGLLRGWIDEITELRELSCVTELVSNSKRIPLSDPDVVRALLLKARSFSESTFTETEKELFASIVNHAQSYDNGIPQDQTVLNRAREQRERNNSNPLLFRLYDRVVRHEENDAELHLKESNERLQGLNRFR